MGRPTKFQADFCEQAEKLCKLGATDVQLSEFFGVTEKTLNNWKHQHPEFLQSLKDGKEIADNEVAASLYHRAIGFAHPEEKIFCTQGEITRADTTKQYPPDTTAAIFWLKNRRPDLWRDRQEVGHDVTGGLADLLREIDGRTRGIPTGD